MPKRLYIPKPFANDSVVAGDSGYIAIANEDGAGVNFPKGFPPAYASPTANNGKFVLRGNLNAIGYLASANEYARACGQIVTFDPNLATKIGGYARGAVLEFCNGTDYCKVISLVDNNMVDFNTVGIDGQNWRRLDQDKGGDIGLICTVPNIQWNSNITASNILQHDQYGLPQVPIGSFYVPRAGKLEVTGSASVSYSTIETGQSSDIFFSPGLIIVCVKGTSGPYHTLGSIIYSIGNFFMSAQVDDSITSGSGYASLSYSSDDVMVKTFTDEDVGDLYGLYAINIGVTLSNSTLKVRFV